MHKEEPQLIGDPERFPGLTGLRLLPGIRSLELTGETQGKISLHLDTEQGFTINTRLRPQIHDEDGVYLVVDGDIVVSRAGEQLPVIVRWCQEMGMHEADITVTIAANCRHPAASGIATQDIPDPDERMLVQRLLLDSPDDTRYLTAIPSQNTVRMATFPTDALGFFGLAHECAELAAANKVMEGQETEQILFASAKSAFPAAAMTLYKEGKIAKGQKWEEIFDVMRRSLRESDENIPSQSAIMKYLVSYARYELEKCVRRARQERDANDRALRCIIGRTELFALSDRQVKLLTRRADLGNLSYELVLRQWEQKTLMEMPRVWEVLQADILSAYSHVSARGENEETGQESILHAWAALRQSLPNG